MIKAFFDGQLIEAGEAALPVRDRSVLFGDAVFETLRAYKGRLFRLDRHVERMRRACAVLRFETPADGYIRSAVAEVLEANGPFDGDARVRVTLTGGEFAGEVGLARSGKPRLIVTAVPYEPPARAYIEGISLVISGIRRNTSSPVSQLKTCNSLDSLMARQEAFDRGADDAVMLTTAGNLAEATTSNLFFVKDGVVSTPDMGCAFLPGVTRDAVLENCRDEGIKCTPVMGGPELLFEADEVFLTNSMFELLPVRILGDHVYDCPGPVRTRLHEAYRALVASELAL
jgi:branched-chain amino acid aminotransferase